MIVFICIGLFGFDLVLTNDDLDGRKFDELWEFFKRLLFKFFIEINDDGFFVNGDDGYGLRSFNDVLSVLIVFLGFFVKFLKFSIFLFYFRFC